MEGHGREEINKNLDVSRTVGWFTSIYPVVLDMENSDELSYQIKLVKETLRCIPKKGIGYGCLRYLSNDPEKLMINPEICFNYMGQFGKDIQNDVFQLSSIPSGMTLSDDMELLYMIDISGIVMDNEMTFRFRYNRNDFNELNVKDLANRYADNLRKLIVHCEQKKLVELTPSDLGYNELGLEEYEDLKSMLETI